MNERDWDDCIDRGVFFEERERVMLVCFWLLFFLLDLRELETEGTADSRSPVFVFWGPEKLPLCFWDC